MKLTDKLLQKVGADKLLHLLLAAWIVALAAFYSMLWMIIVTVIILLLSWAKELWFDDHPDMMDVTAAIVGISFTWAVYLLSFIL